jgi:DNA-binding CsgD family transcriptional regulator
MRFAITEAGAALLITSPDLPEWSRTVRGRDALWSAVGEMARSMPGSDRRRTWRSPPITRDERLAMLPRLVEQGLTTAQIAKRFEISDTQIRTDLYGLGLMSRRARPTVSDRDRRYQQIIDLRAQGLNGREIAERLGVHENTVYNDMGTLHLRRRQAS